VHLHRLEANWRTPSLWRLPHLPASAPVAESAAHRLKCLPSNGGARRLCRRVMSLPLG
jgi:hypothetical protein